MEKLSKRLEIIVNQLCNEAVIYKGNPDKKAFIAVILSAISERMPDDKPKVKSMELILIETRNEELISEWAFVNGFNAALAEMRKVVEEL
jgi:hypothetical protein